jgi:hypothetical protein
MATRLPSFFPQRVNNRVRAMRGVGQAINSGNDIIAVSLGAPSALSANAILDDQAVTSAGSTTTLAATYTASEAQMGRFGRNVTIINSAANTAVITIRGRDFLGQRMTETITSNGNNTVQGVKAFRYIDSVSWAAASTGTPTLDVGLGNVFGLPYKFKQLIAEMKNDIVAANAGTFVAGLATATTATATNADPRGTYLPSTVIPDGTNTFEIRYVIDADNAHGNAHFFS